VSRLLFNRIHDIYVIPIHIQVIGWSMSTRLRLISRLNDNFKFCVGESFEDDLAFRGAVTVFSVFMLSVSGRLRLCSFGGKRVVNETPPLRTGNTNLELSANASLIVENSTHVEVNDTRPCAKDNQSIEASHTMTTTPEDSQLIDSLPDTTESDLEANDTRPPRDEEEDSNADATNNTRPDGEKDNAQPGVVQHLVDISSMLSKFITMEYFSDGGALAQALSFSNRKKKP
jgi:hypothetical protein